MEWTAVRPYAIGAVCAAAFQLALRFRACHGWLARESIAEAIDSSGSQVARDAEADARAARLGRRRDAERRAHLQRIAAPRAAAHDVPLATGIDPRVAVARRAHVVVVPA